MSRPNRFYMPAVEIAEYTGVLLVANLIRLLPVDMASDMMGWLWRTIAPHTKRQVRALTHLKLAFPEKTDAEREEIARGVWENLGRVFAETFLIDRILADPDRLRFEVDKFAANLKNTEKGSVMASMHYGNWELAVWPATQNGLKPMGVYRALRNQRVEAYLRKLREGLYPGGLYSKGDAIGRRAFSLVRSGGHLAMLADQRKNRGVEIPFFGRNAPTNPLPAMVARRLHVPLLAGRVIREGGARFRIEVIEIPVVHTDNLKEDIRATTLALHRQFEDWIRDRPDLWMWAQKRWSAKLPVVTDTPTVDE